MASRPEDSSPLKAPIENGFSNDSYSFGGEGDIGIASQNQGNEESMSRNFYTLPNLRFSTVVRAILFVDGIVSMVLWLTGGDSKYFVDNIINFHLRQSVFDLALLAALKCILGLLLYSFMEENAMQRLQHPYQPNLTLKASLIHTFTQVLSLLALAYSITKGGLILYSFLYDSNYPGMHSTCYALVISSACFSLLELGLALFSFRAMRQLQRQRVLHVVNEQGVEVDKEGKPVKKKVNLLRLVALAKPEVPMIGMATLALFLSSGSQVVAPLFFGQVVDAALKSMEDLNKTVLILLGIYAGGALAAMVRSWLFTLAGHRLVARLRRTLFSAIIRQEVAFFDVSRTGELCNRLSSDTQVLQNAITVNISMLARNLLMIIGSLALMFYLNAALTGVLLAVVPIVSISAVQYGMFVKKLRQQFQDRLAEAGTTAEEALSSIRTVRMFSAEPKSTANYNLDVDKSYAVGRKLSMAGGVFEGVLGVLSYGAISLVLWYGGKLVHQNHLDSTQGISAGIFTSFLMYTLQVAVAFALLSSLYGDFMQAVGASMRIFELLDRLPEIPNDNGHKLSDLDGNVEFKHVRFTYPSRPDTEVLKNVTFKVEPGHMVALVGPSGGGKSTIVSLIERFYDPDSGTILLGGYDLKSLDPQWFRQKISMVSQEPTLFACSIKDNITFGRATNVSDEEIMEAARQANAHEFIMGFEKGYDTLVGERGVRLSGGQKQRVAIARSLIMNPKLLLLDEATSALDAESEHLVQEAIDRAMTGRTVIVIAHRLSTVRNAHMVMVVDKGEIVEQGTHDSLLEKGGVYKRLVLRQLMTSTAPINQSANAEDEEGDFFGGAAHPDQDILQ